MKLLRQPSLFRRYFLTNTLLAFGLLFGAGLYYWNSAPTPEMFENDLAIGTAALALATDGRDPDVALRAAHQLRETYARNLRPMPTAADLQFAVMLDGKTLIKSDAAPDALVDAIRGNTETAVAAPGWTMLSARAPNSNTRAGFAIADGYTRNVLRDQVLSGSTTAIISYLLVALVASLVSSRFAIEPVLAITQRLRDVRLSTLQPLQPTTSFAELEPLVAAINDRTNALKAQLESERTFFSNAAHELRTPLAVIKAQAHAITRANTNALREEREADLQRGVDRAANALGRILQLARLDSVLRDDERGRVDVGHVVVDCSALHAPRAYANRQTLALNDAGSIVGFFSRADLVIVVDNLLDNAINYAGAGANISLTVGREARDGYLVVEDDGPGFNVSDFDCAFKRFQRGSRSDAHAGSGLGLAIVKAAAMRLGGDASVAVASSGRGLRVKIVFPTVA
ncbi:MAG: HAMP domain-containing sensor histidine kinase [Casimicrobium sp.]